VHTADGSVITVAVFRDPVRCILHDGSVDPVSASSRLVRAGPVIEAAERGRPLTAFDGGFLMRSYAGGYEQEAHVFKAPRLPRARSHTASGRRRVRGSQRLGQDTAGDLMYAAS
jgi:hypothetical protein